MINKLDSYIFLRLLSITLFVLGVLTFIFIVIHFSDHSEEFTDQGAALTEVFGIYYFNYIPEIIRLVTPVAVFVACLYLSGQMADRLEIIALKAAGVSLYRLLVPYLVFGFMAVCIISYLDAFIVPDANERRIAFEDEYLNTGYSNSFDNRDLYRQISQNRIMLINYYNPSENKGYNVDIMHFSGSGFEKKTTIEQMMWLEDSKEWRLYDYERHIFAANGFSVIHTDSVDTTLNVLPRDLARTTSDIYRLTWPEAQNYIQSLQRSGATSLESKKVKFYGRLTYPWSIIIVSIVGFAIASVRRKVGKGFYVAAGLLISFIYLAIMKIIEPFGAEGVLSPILTAVLPHLFFLLVGIGLLISTKK